MAISKNNYALHLKVGTFVALGIVVIIAVFLWFSSKNRQDYNTYVSVFNEAVDGLNSSSIVKYNGVEIGIVSSIELDSKNPKNVNVYLKILSSVPINVNTYATLKPQGVTGMSYIDLELPDNSNIHNNLLAHNSPPYPTIPTRPSLLNNLTKQAQTLSANIENIANQVQLVFTPENINHLSNTFSNIDKISSAIAAKSASMSKSIDTLGKVLQNVEQNSLMLTQTMQHIELLTQSLQQTTNNANNLINTVQNGTLQNINTVLLPNLNRTMMHLNQSSYELQDLLVLLNQNPSVIIRGKKDAQLGPGE